MQEVGGVNRIGSMENLADRRSQCRKTRRRYEGTKVTSFFYRKLESAGAAPDVWFAPDLADKGFMSSRSPIPSDDALTLQQLLRDCDKRAFGCRSLFAGKRT